MGKNRRLKRHQRFQKPLRFKKWRLPMKPTYTSRPYADPDLLTLLDLVRARPAARVLEYPSLADLREILRVEDIKEATRLWETVDDRLAGFAILNRGETYASLCMEIPDQVDAQALASQMIAWAEGFFHAKYTGKAAGLTSSATDNDLDRIALLEHHGFTRQEGLALELERDLTQPIPVPEIPQGFIIRSLAGDEEGAWVALHRAAFGTQNMTLRYRQAMTLAPGYDPQLDLVAAAPDGRLAAYVFGSISAEENEQTGLKIGYTDPVGTHPDYQRRGLSHALLLECLRRLRERGMEIARLGTGSWNSAMQRAAQSTGFRIIRRVVLFEKSVEYEQSQRSEYSIPAAGS
jgi:mycothiol synthase